MGIGQDTLKIQNSAGVKPRACGETLPSGAKTRGIGLN